MSGTERLLDVERGRDDHTVDIDDVFGVLAAQRRRAAVHALADHPGGMGVDELVEQVAAWEREVGTSLPPNHEERVSASLYHSHLPKLADLGIVEYDRRSETVRFDDHAAVEEWLDHAAALSLPGSL